MGRTMTDKTQQMSSESAEDAQPGEADAQPKQMQQAMPRRTPQAGDSHESPQMGERAITDWASI